MKFKRNSLNQIIKRILGFLYIVLTLLPSQFEQPNAVTVLFVFVWMAFGIDFFTREHSKIVKYIQIYILIYICISLFLRTGDIHTVVSSLKLFTLCLLCESLYKTDKKFLINMLITLLGIFVLINFITLVIAPNGLFIDRTVVDALNSYDSRSWFLGQSNNQALYFLLLLVIISHKSSDPTMIRRLTLHKSLVICFSFISIISALILNSSTTSFCIILVVLGSYVVYLLKKINNHWSPNAYVVLIVMVVFEVLILNGITNFLEPVIMSLFGKTTSFTNRSDLWEMCFQQIASKPLFGYGYISGDTMRELMGSYAYVNAHNQFLQTLMGGGIFLLIPFIGILMSIIKSANKCIDANDKLYIEILFVSIIVHMTFEISFGAISLLAFFFIFQYAEKKGAGRAEGS